VYLYGSLFGADELEKRFCWRAQLVTVGHMACAVPAPLPFKQRIAIIFMHVSALHYCAPKSACDVKRTYSDVQMSSQTRSSDLFFFSYLRLQP